MYKRIEEKGRIEDTKEGNRDTYMAVLTHDQQYPCVFELARHIGVNPRTVNEICREKRSISPRMAQLLEAALGMSAEFWMNAQAAYDLATQRLSQFEIPDKMPQLAAG